MSKLPVAQQKQQSARRVDRLVRSFPGVIEYVASWSEAGRLYRIDILGDGSVADHQLIRNVVSGLGAGCAIKLDRAAVHVHDEAAAFAAAAAPPAPAPAAPAPAEHAPSGNGHAANGNGRAAVTMHGNGNGNGNGNGHAGNGNGNGKKNGHAANGNGRAATASTNGNGDAHAPHDGGNGSSGARTRSGAGTNGSGARTGTGAAPAPDARRSTPPLPALDVPHGRDGGRRPARDVQPDGSAHRLAPPNRTTPAVASGELQLDRIELERHGPALRCRVVLTLDEHIYAAIAEVPDSATAEAEVAARVTLDALRAGALTCARLDGVGFTSIANTTFVVAAIRDAGNGTPRASAAPLTESMARAASAAVLSAVGPITTIHREEAELRLGAL